MDYYSAMQAITDIQTIKNGGSADLSLAQITLCIVNLQDAEQKLSRAKFKKVYSLFLQYQQKTTKTSYNITSYIETATLIVRAFDAIAPYELYSGGDPQECSALLAEIRQSNPSSSAPSHRKFSSWPYWIAMLVLGIIIGFAFQSCDGEEKQTDTTTQPVSDTTNAASGRTQIYYKTDYAGNTITTVVELPEDDWTGDLEGENPQKGDTFGNHTLAW